MTRNEHLLTIAAEECAELAQRLSKASRFGLEEVQPDTDKNPHRWTNRERILREYADLIGVLEMLDISVETDVSVSHLKAKKLKVEGYLDYAVDCGTLTDGRWECFHCGEIFTDKAAATEHFGFSEASEPSCHMTVAGVRRLEEQVAKLSHIDEQRDVAAEAYEGQSAELARLFDGARTAYGAWLKLEAMESRVLAAEDRLKHLASAMRKTLPPELLKEVLAHLDPLTPFVEFLRSSATV